MLRQTVSIGLVTLELQLGNDGGEHCRAGREDNGARREIYAEGGVKQEGAVQRLRQTGKNGNDGDELKERRGRRRSGYCPLSWE